MSSRLEALIASARDVDPAWDAARAGRIRQGAVLRHETLRRRDRTVRRALFAASAAGLVVLTLLRAASSAPAEQLAASTSASASASASSSASGSAFADQLASRTLGDAGYARD